MDIDLPNLASFLSRPIKAVEVALPMTLKGKWDFPSKVRTNFAAVRTAEGTLLFHYGATPSALLAGIWNDNPWEGFAAEGTVALLSGEDKAAEIDALALPRPFQSAGTLEMVPLERLFPDARPIFVAHETAFELSFTQTIRDGAFRFDVSGLRIYSSEASTIIERGNGGVLEVSVVS